MKNALIALSVILWSSGLSAQSDIPLPGLVVRQNSRVKTGQVEYLSNVNIQATQASPTRSDGQGQFTLVFADKPAYNVTRIFVEKSGMEVVNKTDIERAAVVGRLEKLKIVMCPYGELMENQMRYYGIAEEAIIKRFKKRIAALEAANTGLDKMIAEINEEFNLDLKTKNEAIYALEKEWSEALASAQETAQKFAAINLDDADSLYLQADAAFKKGDFDRVLQLLQYDLLEKNLRNIRSNLSAADSLSAEGRARVARGQENLRQTIQNALFAARVAKLNGAWKRAEDYYDLAVKGDKGDVETLSEAALFMQNQNQFAKARRYYEEALPIYKKLVESKPDVYMPDVASTLNNLGNLLKNNNEMSSARQTLEEALQIYRQLADKNPVVYLPDVAMTLNNLGILLSLNNEMPLAKQSYEEALQIRRKLAEKNPVVYMPDMAMTLNNLGILLSLNNEMPLAKQSYEEALLIYKQFVEKQPEIYLPYVANILNNLGLLLKGNNEISLAKKAYQEALQINRKLAEKNPDVYLPNVASTLNNLGLLLKANNEMIRAKQAYEEALRIRRQLVEKNSCVYLPDVGQTLNNLGLLLKANNEITLSKQAYEEALQIRRQLAEKNPDAYLSDVAGTLTNFGELLLKNNEMSLSKQALEEALSIYRQLAEKKTDAYLPYVANTLDGLGNLLYLNKEMNLAKQTYEEALQLRRQLAEKNPNTFLPDVASTLSNLGVLLEVTNKIPLAKEACEEALQIRRQLAEKNPDVYLPDVAGSLNNLGILLKANNEIAPAKQAFEEALQIRRQLAETSPDAFLPDVGETLNNLGILLKANNDMVGAKKAYEEALQIYRKLAEKNPQVHNLEVTMTHINIGLLYKQLLKSTGDMSLKAAGFELMRDAEQRLAIFPDAHPRVEQYRTVIRHLTQFFNDFDEAAFRLQQQMEHLSALETANETEKDQHQKVQRQQEIIEVLLEIEKVMPGNKKVVNLMAKKYGSLAWYQLFVRQFAEAEQSASVGLAKDPNEEWINTNLVIALLYQGKWDAAKEIYETLKDKPHNDSTYGATFLEDLDALENEGITHPDVAKARKLLEKK